jgi:hypothetical protein
VQRPARGSRFIDSLRRQAPAAPAGHDGDRVPLNGETQERGAWTTRTMFASLPPPEDLDALANALRDVERHAAPSSAARPVSWHAVMARGRRWMDSRRLRARAPASPIVSRKRVASTRRFTSAQRSSTRFSSRARCARSSRMCRQQIQPTFTRFSHTLGHVLGGRHRRPRRGKPAWAGFAVPGAGEGARCVARVPGSKGSARRVGAAAVRAALRRPIPRAPPGAFPAA